MSGSFSYTPTEAHLTTAYKLHWPTGLNWKLLVFIALLALAVAILLAREGPFRLQDIAATTIGGTFAGLAAALIIQWKRGADMLLLYRSDVLFNFVPLSSPDSQAYGDDIVSFLRAANVPERRP